MAVFSPSFWWTYRKTQVFLKHQIGSWCFWRSRTAVNGWCSKNGCLCSTGHQMHYGGESTYYHISGVYHDTLVGSINFFEALSKQLCEKKTMMLYKELLNLGSHFKETTLLLSCRKVLPPAQSDPQSACMCNWWRPSLCSCSQCQGDYLLPLGKKQMWELIHCLTLMDYSVLTLSTWHSEEHITASIWEKLFFTLRIFYICLPMFSEPHVFHNILKVFSFLSFQIT